MHFLFFFGIIGIVCGAFIVHTGFGVMLAGAVIALLALGGSK